MDFNNGTLCICIHSRLCIVREANGSVVVIVMVIKITSESTWVLTWIRKGRV